MFKDLFKSKAAKIWLIVSSALIVIAVVVSILASAVFFDTISSFLGRRIPIYADGTISMYPALESTNKTEALANANEKNIEICGEGFVLLKNEEVEPNVGALPLAKGSKVSIFGKNSVSLSYGGSGSSAFVGVEYKTLYDSLEGAGFKTNGTLKAFYEDDGKSGPKRSTNSSDLDSGDNVQVATGETPQNRYTDAVKASYSEYNDAAIVVITRIGGEGFDLPRYQGTTEGASNPDDHYLELDKNERDLLSAVCSAGFKKVVVLFNIPASFEATFLTDTEYAPFANEIDAALWIGFTGGEGIMALGSILNGDINPSGRTVDTWASDFSKDPTFNNFGTGPNPDCSDKYDAGMYYFVDYEENVYVGYRYYETRGLDDEDWYARNVVYPFGYGLSYTTFEMTLKNKPSTAQIIGAKDKVTVEVDVKNTGNTAGKEVVQLYCELPYDILSDQGAIEKPVKVLVGFAKTEMIDPGHTKTVKITFDPYTAASYDYRDANDNGFSGYELEAGDYNLCVSRSAHEVVDKYICRVASDITYDKDPVTETVIENRYTDREGVTDSDYQLSTILSRNNWENTWPDVPTDAERAVSKEILAEIQDSEHNNPVDYSEKDMPDFEEDVTVKLRDLLPAETPEMTYEPIVDYYDERWDDILDACDANELMKLYDNGCYSTLPVQNVGLPATQHGDGPSGFTYFLGKGAVSGTCHYCSEPVMSSTWNNDLIQELGRTIGEEGIWGNEKIGQPYSSIYAPGVNIHRSPFGGRNAEYFSEDPLLSGKMAAAEIRGCQETGVVCMVKHFVANEQETHRARYGDCSWLTEQSLREIYLKPFEIAVKEGKSRGLMTSFNRIGTRWTGGDYRLLTEILREEWGFRGTVICDFNTHPEYMFTRQMAYAGGDLNLANWTAESWCDPTDTGDAIILRQCAKNIMYSLVNSNAMNGDVIGYKMPTWQLIMIIIDCAIVTGIAVWGFFAVRKAVKKNKTAKNE